MLISTRSVGTEGGGTVRLQCTLSCREPDRAQESSQRHERVKG